MNEDFAFADHFKREHEVIFKKMDLIQKLLNSGEPLNRVDINHLQWLLERHFYLEEKSIFLYYKANPNADKTFIHQLIIQHDVILAALADVKSVCEKVCKEIEEAFTKLNSKLSMHYEYEKEFLYNELDQKVTTEEKIKFSKFFHQNISTGYFPLKSLREFGFKQIQESKD
jgi:hypothetical protein